LEVRVSIQKDRPPDFKVGDRVINPEENIKGIVTRLAGYGAVQVRWDGGQQQLMETSELCKDEG
jgi:hypothetical protein